MSYTCSIQKPEHVRFTVECYNNIDGVHCPDDNCSLCNNLYIVKQYGNTAWYTTFSTHFLSLAIEALHHAKETCRLLISPLNNVPWDPLDIRINSDGTIAIYQENRTNYHRRLIRSEILLTEPSNHPMWDILKEELSIYITYCKKFKKEEEKVSFNSPR
jgi:hypothetical protein